MLICGLENIKKVYFIGIGGISMSALAKLLSTLGYEVSGSDKVGGEQTKQLAFYNIPVYIGEDVNCKALRGADVVVYTDAVPMDNPLLEMAKKSNKTVLSRGELLGLVAGAFRNVITVAGSHGKTTCSSFCAHVLKATGMPFTAHIGGEDSFFGNFHYAGDEFFITEACEYKRNLLKIPADKSILLNIDLDHMECYKDKQDLIDCFKSYCNNAKTAFVCADDDNCKGLGEFVTFGIENKLCDYRAVDLKAINQRYSFVVEEYGKPICRIKLNALGKCNVYNALASFAVMRSYGFDEKIIKSGLETFSAVKRRFEYIGKYNEVSFIADYAHHPKELVSTIATAKGICKGKLYVVFQPHTYSRTKHLMQDFILSLKDVENLMVYKTYPAREKFDEEGSGKRLAEKIGCLYAENIYTLKTWIKRTVKEGDIVLFLGAGDIYYGAQYLLKSM